MTYETDKEVLGFVPEYQRIAGILGPAARVCEIGVLNGLGLTMLQDMYPQGTVAGVDFSPASRWPEGTIRIVTSQDDPALPAILSKQSEQWDLFIDDASHKGHLTKATFNLLWPLVAPGGFYVIEDWFIGSPLWPSTGCWGGAPVGSAEAVSSYDPELLHVVQDLVLLLDKPYCGVGTPGQLANSEAESVSFRYGMAIVRKTTA
jgi:predicted O-methyltransferase YrrM